MRWAPRDPKAWRTKFAFFPVRIHDRLVWLESYRVRFVRGGEFEHIYERAFIGGEDHPYTHRAPVGLP